MLSAEEKALRERMRQSAKGIVSYQLSSDGERIMCPVREPALRLDLHFAGFRCANVLRSEVASC